MYLCLFMELGEVITSFCPFCSGYTCPQASGAQSAQATRRRGSLRH